MYKIGEFSKIVNIPVRTLRYYDEIGLLRPSVIDQYTGYRYYDDNNINECKLIKLLKSLDFTLEEIITHKNSINYELLENKKEDLNLKMELLKMKYAKLTYMQEHLKEEKV